MKKIIYGVSNYKMAREDNYLYIDKTKYIEKLEDLNEKFLIFCDHGDLVKVYFSQLFIITMMKIGKMILIKFLEILILAKIQLPERVVIEFYFWNLVELK